MIKKLQKYGNSLVIRFDRMEIVHLDLKEGELLDIGPIRKIKGDENAERQKA